MFLFGILSSPLPYLLMAVFYFFGFATGMFKGNADNEPEQKLQVNNIQAEPQTKTFEINNSTFQFHDYKFQENTDNYAVISAKSPAVRQKEKLIYFVHDINTHHLFTSEYNFCRPPPSCS